MFNKLQKIHGLIYSLEMIGPNPIAKSSDPIFNYDEYLRIGNLFFLAVGQGNHRSYGLYELPVSGYQELHALVYAFDIHDQLNFDRRNNQNTYCLFVLIFFKELREYLPHITYIEELISKTLSNYNSIDKLKTQNPLITIINALNTYIPSTDIYTDIVQIKMEDHSITTI